jgi:D-alanyl-D-alanine carboxypeptidase/D-alanyl-D-alanine-endopeptidase (penicillin-binding protein 4)
MRLPPCPSARLLALTLAFSLGVAPARADDTSRAGSARSYAKGEAFRPITEDADFKYANYAIQVVNARTGDEVWSWDADELLAPASVTKVVTTAAGLKRLGAGWRFHTWVMHDGEITKDGVLEGNLYIKGGGDPTFVIEKAWKIVHDLRRKGITEIKGDLIFDDGYFDREHLITGWDKRTDIASGPPYFAPIGALTLANNTAGIVVEPGFEVDSPARVSFEVEAPKHLIIESEAKTVAKGRRPWLELEREVDPKDFTVTFKLKGDVPLGSDPEVHYRAVGNPLAFTISAVEKVFRDERMKFTGRVKVGETPRPGTGPKDAKLLIDMASPPLHEIANHTNKYSSNLMAEQILKALGAEIKGLPGTTSKGVGAVSEYLAQIGVPVGTYTMINGSGLARDTRFTPAQINAVLLDMVNDPRVGPEFLASLSVAGVDGTLRRRFDDAGDGLVRGKTGSLNSVNCVTGYVRGSDGDMYVFTVLANDVEKGRAARSIQDQVAQTIMKGLGAPPLQR